MTHRTLFRPANEAVMRTLLKIGEVDKVEPYVVAADVYGVAPHVGRGGWTWYTGSAGWMYRAAVESILGFRVRGARLSVDRDDSISGGSEACARARRLLSRLPSARSLSAPRTTNFRLTGRKHRAWK